MLAKESVASSPFDLPEEVLAVLPSDPFEQLDVARKITSVALFSRISSLESESCALQAKLEDKDNLIADLQYQIQSLDSSLSDSADKLAQADLDKEKLLKENASLSSTVRKLQRDVSKLEVFRKTLMQSLQEDEDNTGSSGPRHIIAKPTPSEDDITLPPSRTRSVQSSHFSEIGNSYNGDHETEVSRPGISHNILLASQTSTPRFTPPGSPPSLSASVSPTRTSKPVSPRRHSMSFSTSRGFSDGSSMFSSLPSQSGSMSSSDSTSHTGRTRIDGKEFFRQVRTRLSYEQFGAFLANVKELNSHKQTKEDTLRKADEIFGPDNKDLYTIFEGLITQDDITLPPSRTSSVQSSHFSEIGNSYNGNHETADSATTTASRPGISHNILLASQTSTPRFTPPGSPPSLSASVSPTRTSKPVSPRRHSMSFSTSRGFSDGSSMFSSLPSQSGSVSSSDSTSHTGRTRIDGKEFFRQVRTRLSYEQFGAFLANVKELNSHKQTKEDTLRKADDIFGPDNKDLYTIFEGLITRNIH